MAGARVGGLWRSRLQAGVPTPRSPDSARAGSLVDVLRSHRMIGSEAPLAISFPPQSAAGPGLEKIPKPTAICHNHAARTPANDRPGPHVGAERDRPLPSRSAREHLGQDAHGLRCPWRPGGRSAPGEPGRAHGAQVTRARLVADRNCCIDETVVARQSQGRRGPGQRSGGVVRSRMCSAKTSRRTVGIRPGTYECLAPWGAGWLDRILGGSLGAIVQGRGMGDAASGDPGSRHASCRRSLSGTQCIVPHQGGVHRVRVVAAYSVRKEARHSGGAS